MRVELKTEYRITYGNETIIVKQFYEAHKPTGVWAYETSPSGIRAEGQASGEEAVRDAKAMVSAAKADRAAQLAEEAKG